MNSIYSIEPDASYPLASLLAIKTNQRPKGFDDFWCNAYQNALQVKPQASIKDTGNSQNGWQVFDVSYTSTDDFPIGGWLLLPVDQEVRRLMVVIHGYGGREGPDFHLPFADAALFFPCCRGIARSARAPISTDPYWHVLHDIHQRNRYILRGCVEDVWVANTVLGQLYPHLSEQIGMLGISFGGGIGTIATAYDKRVAKAHFNVPTFGDHQIRLKIATQGSGKALQDFYRREPYKLIRTLRYFDTAFAAQAISVPVHFALALRDPVVTPPGQFAIYNQVQGEKHLFILQAGHAEYPQQAKENQKLIVELANFFS